MDENISNKISDLRAIMQKNGVQFLIIPTSDPHLSEYVADHWKSRAWITGFTGSAGTAVISTNEAGLWTDSRYFLQAEEQLAGSGITLYKEGIAGTPSINEWICSKANAGACIGIDGDRFSANDVAQMQQTLDRHGLHLKCDASFINELWHDAPALPQSALFPLDIQYAGESLSDKLARTRAFIKKSQANALLITALDEVAWTFNLRASDVDFNPVAIAYAIVYENSAALFTDCHRISDEGKMIFKNANVELHPYDYIYKVLNDLPKSTKIIVDKCKANYALTHSIDPENIVEGSSPITFMKSIKNEVEVAGIHKAVVKDGVAMAYAFRWLEECVKSGQKVTEMDFAEKLYQCRSQQANFFCESFGTIAGYGRHGAIVHYSATEESNAVIGQESLLLVDSGANYFDGTTDITRTIIIGSPSKQQKLDYTNVLKGHIALASIQFPQGTHGAQLDVLARQFLWNAGEDYGHGTGHGIGHFLCVHEGPQNIRIRDNGTELQKGMLISNEPGLYKTGQYGIRTENMVLVQEGETTEFGRFLQFETLSLFPFDSKLIETSMLNEKERNWINQYHQKVWDKISPLLDEETQKWLAQKVKTI